MQQTAVRRSNPQRTDATRAAITAAARRLFVQKGYADTGTPEIVAAAGVTRGALYHHFQDKADLFMAVAREAAGEVAREITRRSRRRPPLDALLRGAEAYFAAMAGEGRARLLLLDAPAILPPAQLRELSDMAGAAELRQGLEEALPPRRRKGVPLDQLTALVSAAFDRAALAIAQGESPRRHREAMRFVLTRLVGRSF